MRASTSRGSPRNLPGNTRTTLAPYRIHRLLIGRYDQSIPFRMHCGSLRPQPQLVRLIPYALLS
ncbi:MULTISPECIES: hypothetical protein [Bacillus]|uniref:hypothetical protein n=1 Tax=Bacillus TaxID=1386 RepID=UPI0015D4B569|nr:MULTISPECIES: hypothetical protein [Bacillus]MBT2201184.1 hypothetical protein [Bacillus thuringiensis]